VCRPFARGHNPWRRKICDLCVARPHGLCPRVNVRNTNHKSNACLPCSFLFPLFSLPWQVGVCRPTNPSHSDYELVTPSRFRFPFILVVHSLPWHANPTPPFHVFFSLFSLPWQVGVCAGALRVNPRWKKGTWKKRECVLEMKRG